MFRQEEDRIWYTYNGEKVSIQSWGKNALRIRATLNATLRENNWGLLPRTSDVQDDVEIKVYEDLQANGEAYANMYMGTDNSNATITNGKIIARINGDGVISFYNQQKEMLLCEDWKRLQDDISAPLNILGREYEAGEGENYHLHVRFKPKNNEKIFGMGQYQQQEMDLKGCSLELAQRNSQVSVPFYISNKGYGFLWNNPGVGRVVFAKNGTEWEAYSSKEIDYLIIAGDSPAEIQKNYMKLTGLPPMMPEYGLGFWQCKLRYQSQEELMEVARRYKEEGIPLDVIIADFFHWPKQGDFKFDQQYWPDVEGMCQELEKMGTKLMVSVWPTVDAKSENYKEMREKGYLVKTNRGVDIQMTCGGNEVFFDATIPEARKFVWKKIKQNYWEKGAKLYWLDVAEPEFTSYDFDNYRYSLGSTKEVGNIYPRCYLQGFYDGMQEEGDEQPLCLVRSAWIGSARYGGLVWSGDIVSNFECFRRQVQAGLNMAIAGIPWWTTDIGGFHGGTANDSDFRELFARWFAYGCFSPVMRLHGNRNPQLNFEGTTIGSGSPNEIWSFGEEIFAICKRYIALRERMRPYVRHHMEIAHKEGIPIMRPYFYDYPEQAQCWEIEDAYLFGTDLIVAPVLDKGAMGRTVFLPEGKKWIHVWSGREYQGGQEVYVEAPLNEIPVFCIENSDCLECFLEI